MESSNSPHKHKHVPRDPEKLYPHDYVMKYTFVPLIPKFIHPNMITFFRFLLVPVVLWYMFTGQYEIAIPVFLFTAFTDALDGSVARIRKQITAWGTFYDPVADKLLISTVVMLIVVKYINVYFGLLIILIELLIVIGGLVRRHRGRPATANVFGKTKMSLQVLGVFFLLLAVHMGVDLFIDFSIGTLSLAIVFAIISLFTYGL